MDAAAIRDKVFISYSHHDAKWLDRLHVHLAAMEKAGKIAWWDDTKIEAGSLWHENITTALSAARVAVLLISADFFASNFIATYELPPLLAAAQSAGAVILPVLVSASDFQDDKSLSEFQSVNPPSKPLIKMTEAELEDLWHTLSKTIAGILNSQPVPVAPKKNEDYIVSSSALLQQPDILPDAPDDPPAVGIFINRQDDIDAIKQFLNIEARRMVVIQGFIGIGKTQLAAKLAKEINNKFTAVCWITCKENQDAPDSLFSVLHAFFEEYHETGLRGIWNDPARSLEQKISRLIQLLRQKPYLIIFDKFQHWLSPDSQLSNPGMQLLFAGMLKADHQSKLLLLSDNRPLLDPRSLAFPIGTVMERTLLGLDSVHAKELLRETGFETVDEALLQRIVDYCDGHPSILQIFSYLVTSLRYEPEELLTNDELQLNFNGLLLQATKNLEKESYDLLQLLCVFRRPLNKQAINSLGFNFNNAARPLLDRFLLLENNRIKGYLVATLVRTHLLGTLPPATYRLLQERAVAFYAAGRSGAAPATYHELELLLEESYHNFESGSKEKGAAILVSAATALVEWGYIDMAEQSMLTVLKNSENKNIQTQARWYQACIADVRGNHQLALDHFKFALESYREAGNYSGMALASFRIGRVYNGMHALDDANHFFEQCISICKTHGIKDGWAASLLGMGWNAQERSTDIEAQLDPILALYQESIRLATALGDAETLSSAHRQLGFLLWTKRELQTEAIDHYDQALKAAQDHALLKEQGGIYSELGYLYSEWNQAETARTFCGKAIDIFLSLGNYYGLSSAYLNLGKTYEQEGQLDMAIGFYNKSKITAVNINNHGAEAWACYSIGRLLARQGKMAEAASVLQRAVSISQQYHLGETQSYATDELRKILPAGETLK